jgi:arylsulfatase A-like enzyme/Tfp pilus assembly protein PilF
MNVAAPRLSIRRWLRLAGLLAVAVVIAVGSVWRLTPVRPNLLLITLDTTRADRLGCYGHAAARTPTLDALARSGVRFERAFATAPLTLPSHATMMTGLYPPEHGLRTNGKGRLHKDVPACAATLKRAGYRTAAFVGAFVLDSKFGLDQGFDVYDDDLTGTRRTEDPLHRERSSSAVVDRALDWLSRFSRRPFFCWVHLYDPHFPYQPHVEDFGDDFRRAPYDGEIAYVDRQVQRLTAFLESRGLTDRTLIMVVGDHGEGLGDHEEEMHGYMLYNSTLHVPWIVSRPRQIPSGAVVSQPVSLVDVMPTVLDCLDVPPPPKISGRSLVPAFSGEPTRPSPCYAETEEPRLDNGWSGLQMFLTPEWKYIRTARPELYRWIDDVHESENRAADEPEQAAELDRQLVDFLSGLSPRGTDVAALTSRDKQVLASLGYTGGQSSVEPVSLADAPDIKDMIGHFNDVVHATHLMDEGKTAEAEALLRKVVAAAPDYAAAWGNLGRTLAQQGRFDEAIDCYNEVLRRRPEDVSALLNIGTARLVQQKPKDAAEVLERVLDIDPENADAFFYLAGADLQQGLPGEAYARYTQALDCDPEHVESLRGLADLLFERGQLEKALEHYAAAIRIDPYAPGPYVNRGIALGQLQRLDEAVASFQEGLSFAPNHPLLHSNLGFALQKLGRDAQAVEHYTQALEFAPEEPQALVQLPWLLSASNDERVRDGRRALELAQRAVAASQGASVEAYDSLAAAYAELGRFDEALQAIDTARRIAGNQRDWQRTLDRRAANYRSGQAVRGGR